MCMTSWHTRWPASLCRRGWAVGWPLATLARHTTRWRGSGAPAPTRWVSCAWSWISCAAKTRPKRGIGPRRSRTSTAWSATSAVAAWRCTSTCAVVPIRSRPFRAGRVSDPAGVADERDSPRSVRHCDGHPHLCGQSVRARSCRSGSGQCQHRRAGGSRDQGDAGAGCGRRRSARGRPRAARGVSCLGAAPGGRSPMIRVVVADDQALVRAGCRALFDTEDDIEFVGEAETGSAALEVVRAARPDVVLMDIRMPDLDGLEATRTITTDPRLADVRVLILTTFALDEYVFEALRAGASGFLLKDAEPEDLVRAVRVVAGGEALLSPAVTRRLIAEFVARPERLGASPASLEELTDREREVLSLVAMGLSNDEIAEELVISPATVRTHINRVMMKLGAGNRAQLVVIAYEAGLVAPGRRD